MIALMMGLSMMLGIRVYCKEWLEAASCLLWIACWAVWYGIWKKYIRTIHENRHLKNTLISATAGLVAVRHILDDEDDKDDKKGDNANAEANKDNNDGQEAK